MPRSSPRTARSRLALALATAGLLACGGDETREGADAPPASPSVAPQGEPAPAEPAVEPPREAPRLLAIDTHSDTTQRMLDEDADLSQRLPDGHVDLVRMREGGLTGVFLSIWVDPRKYRGERAWRRTLALIARVETLVRDHPEAAALCTTGAEVRAAFEADKAAILMGVEGAHGLGTSDLPTALERARQLYRRGVRYMTITWSTDNDFGHSATGRQPLLGLTDAGRALVTELNALGMMVDISHVSDATFEDILGLSTRPVIASHSSCRELAAHPRNLSDTMIRRVAEGGGAVCVNFYAQFLDADYRAARRRVQRQHPDAFAALQESSPHYRARAVEARALAQRLAPGLAYPTVERLADHIAHVVEVGGPGAACLGSDFDGVGELPEGMRDVSDLPVLRAALEARGLPVAAVFGENVLRVLDAQQPAGATSATPPTTTP